MNYKVLCLALVLAGCSSSSTTTAAKGDYKLNLTAFAPHASEAAYLKIKDATGATTIASTMTTIDATGNATFVLPAALDVGTTYRVDFFCDHTPASGTGGAYVPPTAGTPPTFNDHSWRRMVVGTSAGVVESFAHDSNWTDISPF
ncbi:MAG: hypothetical protein ABIP39_08545 [Polyangiaceae bacterium]